MAALGFRAAIECLIDKTLLADRVLSGQVEPLDSLILPANVEWASAPRSAPCAGSTAPARRHTALRILEDAGFRWDQVPDVSADSTSPGIGLRMPDGSLVPQMDLLVEDSTENPFAIVYGTSLEEQASELGMPLRVERLNVSSLTDRIFSGPADWDMLITSWDLGDMILPTYFQDLFASWNDASVGGLNLPGYTSEEFDRLAEELNRTTDVGRARQIVWQMDAIVTGDRPYIPLYTPNLTEALGPEISLPIGGFLGGLQGLAGAPWLAIRR